MCDWSGSREVWRPGRVDGVPKFRLVDAGDGGDGGDGEEIERNGFVARSAAIEDEEGDGIWTGPWDGANFVEENGREDVERADENVVVRMPGRDERERDAAVGET